MKMASLLALVTLDLLTSSMAGDSTSWADWWSYDGISGPEYWGLLNRDWTLCRVGKLQSPVDITPNEMIFDPNLSYVKVDNNKVNGILINTGQDISFKLNITNLPYFTFTGGPLSYTYTVYEVKLHFGSRDQRGSEHTVSGQPFPAEIQILGFNSDLFESYSQALSKSHGIAAIAIFGIIGEDENQHFEMLVQATKATPYKGDQIPIAGFFLFDLIPPTEFYVTYEGSLTYPSCMETVTWIILNKPVYITRNQIVTLRTLHKAPENSPDLLMENNFRPPLPINRRTIRTNIAPKSDKGNNCGIMKKAFYEVNEKYRYG